MAVSHLVCALSQQPESFGRTVLEAMALGKPVVGYDCGGVGEIGTHSEIGKKKRSRKRKKRMGVNPVRSSI
jgi:glycosyltransferase involved in cell wall biosynthesis